MGKLTKILAPITAFLTVVACVACVLGYYEFKKYKARATKLAQSIADNTRVLDEKSNSGVPEKVTFIPSGAGVALPAPQEPAPQDTKAPENKEPKKADGKVPKAPDSKATPEGAKEPASEAVQAPVKPSKREQGTLSYPENRKDTIKLDEALQATADLTKKVMEQRNSMAKTLEALSISLKNTQVKQDDLCKLDTYKAKLTLAENYAKTAYATYDEFARNLENIGKLLAKSRPYAGKVRINRTIVVKGTSAVKPNNNGNYATLTKAITELYNQKDQYEQALKALEQIITEFNFSAKPRGINYDNHVTKVKQLRNDFRNINNKLKELKRVLAELKAARAEIARLKKQVASLQAENKKLLQQIDVLKKEQAILKGTAEEESKKNSKLTREQVDPNLVGKVILFNKTWNFVICNLGDEQIVKGVEVIISSNNQALASGVISTVEPTISIIELTWNSGKDIPKDAKVFIKPLNN